MASTDPVVSAIESYVDPVVNMAVALEEPDLLALVTALESMIGPVSAAIKAKQLSAAGAKQLADMTFFAAIAAKP